MCSFFGTVPEGPPIEVYALTDAYKKDENVHKLNLGVGAYRTNDGQPWVLPVVRSVEASLAADVKLDKEYLPVRGIPGFCFAASKLVLGEDCSLIASKKADSCQTLGGTGAVYLALRFLHDISDCKMICISNPSWPNHRDIGSLVGMTIVEYRYWDPVARQVDFKNMMDDINSLPQRCAVILHACAHNPTGTDLSQEQWMALAEVMKAKKLLPVFDLAYQGFGSGDLDTDAWAIRHFVNQGFEMFIAQSFSKNFGLYNERVGNLIFITNDALITTRVKSQLEILIRRTWSNPPQHGARIVDTILNNPTLYTQWKDNLSTMASRVREMRRSLYNRLRELGTPGSWEHIITQVGMFSFTGLSGKQVEYLRAKYHIYLMHDGRANMCGLTTNNIDYVANAINDATRTVQD